MRFTRHSADVILKRPHPRWFVMQNAWIWLAQCPRREPNSTEFAVTAAFPIFAERRSSRLCRVKSVSSPDSRCFRDGTRHSPELGIVPNYAELGIVRRQLHRAGCLPDCEAGTRRREPQRHRLMQASAQFSRQQGQTTWVFDDWRNPAARRQPGRVCLVFADFLLGFGGHMVRQAKASPLSGRA